MFVRPLAQCFRGFSEGRLEPHRGRGHRSFVLTKIGPFVTLNMLKSTVYGLQVFSAWENPHRTRHTDPSQAFDIVDAQTFIEVPPWTIGSDSAAWRPIIRTERKART